MELSETALSPHVLDEYNPCLLLRHNRFPKVEELLYTMTNPITFRILIELFSLTLLPLYFFNLSTLRILTPYSFK